MNNELEKIYTREWLNRIQKEEVESARAMIASVVRELKPTSILDVGSGPGNHVNFLRESLGKAVPMVAMDGVFFSRDFLKDKSCFYLQDFRESFSLEIEFHTVLCFEVIEHLDEKYEEVFCNSVARHVQKYLLISAARP